MNNLFRLIAAKSTLLILFVPGISLSNPIPVAKSQLTINAQSETNNLVCYMETENGQIVNLESLCQKQTTNENNNSENSVNGAKCFLVDANGNPCPSSSPVANARDKT